MHLLTALPPYRDKKCVSHVQALEWRTACIYAIDRWPKAKNSGRRTIALRTKLRNDDDHKPESGGMLLRMAAKRQRDAGRVPVC